ncbi:phage tail tube protein [Aeromonas caviae]|uniref:phage tail tube protein n=1 Tax=Aeromonas caviae TaxID=648 RepID=UPI0022547BAA|nr:phage tail tube protein [Aeromonas caviae]MCX4037778.1 phage tail tube protein [Aeromonas caviae]
MTDATKPVKGAGTELYMAKVAGATKPDLAQADSVVRLADVKEITPPDMSVEVTEESYLDAPNPDWKEKSPGQKDPGQLGFTLAWKPGDPAQKTVVAELGGVHRWFLLKYPNGAVDGFYGFISSLGKPVQIKETITRTVKVDLSGKQDLAETAA